jgi:histidinol-phosphate aminotransferase
MLETTLAELVRPELSEVSAYLPVTGDFQVRLDANEAPPLLSERARRRLAEAAATTSWERYPDARLTALRAVIALRMHVSPEEILVGVGSDELIAMLVTALSRPRVAHSPATLVTTTPSFVMYRMSGRVRGWRVLEVPLDEQWDISQNGIERAIGIARPNLLFVASPNNPTGTLASRDRLEAIIEAAAGALVVIDEAYVDYASRDQLELYRKHANVAILRTLSKVGFAALRIGWLVARPELVHEIDKTRLPYNVPSVSQSLATLVLSELYDELVETARFVVGERKRLENELAGFAGIEITPSEANFIWLRTPKPAGEVYAALAERGVLVRSFHQRGGRLSNQLRVTVGTRAENDALLEALRGVS